MFHSSSSFPKRKLDKTVPKIETSDGCVMTHKEFEQLFAKKSMFPAVPVKKKFFFMGIHPCVDVHKTFQYEPMNCLSLGLERVLKNGSSSCSVTKRKLQAS